MANASCAVRYWRRNTQPRNNGIIDIVNKRRRHPEHLPNAALSFVGLVACTVMGGELLSDILNDEDNFPQVPEMLKPFAALVFVAFAALEANKVRGRLTKAWGRK